MLELTRRVDQGITIGRDHKLFVRALDTGVATVRLYCSVYDVQAPIVKGRPYIVEIDGERIAIHVIKVERGQVRFGFEAPRSIAINRIERTPK